MSEFKVIETQEQFDLAIKDRIERERNSVSEKYSDYEEIKKKNSAYEKQLAEANKSLQDLNKKVSEYDENIATLNARIKGYESDSVKTRIALELGLPYEMAQRLNGDDEDSIRKDAQALSKLFNPIEVPPTKDTETSEKYSGKKAGLKKMLSSIEN